MLDVFDKISKIGNDKKNNAKWKQDLLKWDFEVELSIIEVFNEKIINLLGKYQDEGEKILNFSKTAKIVSSPKDTIKFLS